MSTNTMIGLARAALVPAFLIWFSISLAVYLQGKKRYRFFVTVFLFSMILTFGDLVRLRFHIQVFGIDPNPKSPLVLIEAVIAAVSVNISTFSMYADFFRDRFLGGGDPYMTPSDDEEKDRKLEEQSARVDNVLASLVWLHNETAQIRDRVRNDDPIFLGGRDKRAGGHS